MKKCKKITAIFLAILLLISAVPFAGIYTISKAGEIRGKLSDTISYYFYNGDLYISGTGDMEDYDVGTSPFAYDNTITGVIIRPGVTGIGDYTFYHCENIVYLTIYEENSTVKIGNHAFDSCYSLEDIPERSADSSIGDYAFYNCTSLWGVSIRDSHIGSHAFDSCESLSSVHFYTSVENIGDSAFINCDFPNIQGGFFYDGIKEQWKNINFGSNNDIILENVEFAYGYNYILGVDGKATITSCEGHPNDIMFIPNELDGHPVSTIGDCAFKDMTGIYSVEIANGITSIEGSAFLKCSDLKEIVLPDSLLSIGDYAFSETNLENITIPESVTNIGDEVFRTCFNLKSIKLPTNVSYMGERVFYDCYSLEYVSLPNGLKNLGMFFGCISLKNVTIPDSVTTILFCAFEGCSGLTSLSIPKNVRNIESCSFNCCGGLESITVDKNNTFYDSRDNCNAIIETKSNTLILGCCNTVFPDSVTKIGDYAFFGNYSIYDFTIPEGITEIGKSAFEYCYNLTSITIPRSVTKINDHAFSACYNFRDIYFNGSEEEWSKITIDDYDNEYWEDVNIHFHEHSYSSEATTPATCTQDGVMTYTCQCGETYTEVIPASGHTMGGWKVAVEPTTTVSGVLRRQCKNCDYFEEMDMGFADVDKVKGITLSSNNENLIPGEKVTLEAIIDPETADNKNIIWSSSDSSIASVADGVVTANNIGSAVIIAKTEDGGYKDFCLIKVVGITASSGSTVIDTESNLIYGLAPNIDSIDDYVTLTDDSTTIEYDSDTLGTGSVVNIVKNGEIVDSYEIVIFGDSNGDGWYDGTDAMTVKFIANGMLGEKDVGKATYTAADCNHDGAIDYLDVELLEQAGILLANVDQSKSNEELLNTNSSYAQYLNIIDQSIDTKEEASDELIEFTYTPTMPRPDYQLNIFEKITVFFMAIWKYIFSFITF